MADNTANNNKPFTQYVRIGNGSFDKNEWKNGGRNSVRFKVANKLRSFVPTPDNPEPSSDYQNFKDYGQFEIYPSDVPGILDVCSFLRPDDMEITVRYVPRRVA